MTPENFVYWLQGYLELANPSILDEKTILMIKEHLDLVHNGLKFIPVSSKEEFLESLQKVRLTINPELICAPSDLSDTVVFC